MCGFEECTGLAGPNQIAYVDSISEYPLLLPLVVCSPAVFAPGVVPAQHCRGKGSETVAADVQRGRPLPPVVTKHDLHVAIFLAVRSQRGENAPLARAPWGQFGHKVNLGVTEYKQEQSQPAPLLALLPGQMSALPAPTWNCMGLALAPLHSLAGAEDHKCIIRALTDAQLCQFVSRHEGQQNMCVITSFEFKT